MTAVAFNPTAAERSAILRASDGDRAWFAANPRRSHRLRRAIAGEFGLPLEFTMPGEPWTVVRQIVPGVRQKLPFAAPCVPPDIEEIAHALFDLLGEAMRTGTDFAAVDVEARAAAMSVRGRA